MPKRIGTKSEAEAMFVVAQAESGDESKGVAAPLSHSTLSNSISGPVASIADKKNIGCARAPALSAGARSSSGMGVLSLIALIFSDLRQALAADPDVTFLDDDSISYKDLAHGIFEIVTKEAIPRHILVEDPGQTLVLRGKGSSMTVNQVTNSATQMEEFYAAQQEVLDNSARGFGPSGSSTPPSVNSPPYQPINFVQPDAPSVQNSLPAIPSIFVVPDVIIPFAGLPTVTAGINHAPAITSESDPALQTVIVNPVALAQGINTNSLGLSTETFDGLPVGSGNFHSAALDATFSGSGNVGVINGSIPGVTVALFLGPLPGSVDTTNYLSISSGGAETITFGSEKNTFGLYWGTIDLANTITFYDRGTLVASYTGSEVVGLLSANQGIFDSNGYIEFVGIHPFDRVVLDTGNTNAFEVENISAGVVPDHHAKLAAPISGTLSVHDADIGDALTASVTGNGTIEFIGSSGSTTLPNGADVAALVDANDITFDAVQTNGGTQVLRWTYNPHDPDLDFLKSGDKLTIRFTAQVNDGHGDVGNQALTISIVGADASANTSGFRVVSGTAADETFHNVGNGVTIFGGGGHDNFVFNAGFRAATIGDFNVANDTIEIDHNLFSSIAEILAAARDSGTDTIITAPTAHDTITLKGVAAANLQAFDFHLF
jgi:VCBS repeat-containing protein